MLPGMLQYGMPAVSDSTKGAPATTISSTNVPSKKSYKRSESGYLNALEKKEYPVYHAIAIINRLEKLQKSYNNNMIPTEQT